VNSIAKRFHNFVPLCLCNFVPFASFVVRLPKMKTKPKQSQTKPIFWRSFFEFSPKTGIFDKFRTTFLCKTKPNSATCPAPKSLVLWSFVVKLPKMLQKCHKSKTNPKRTQTNPFFQGSIFDFSPKTRIVEDFRQTFLCKTNPFFSKIQIENKGLTAVSQSSAGTCPERAPRVERAI